MNEYEKLVGEFHDAMEVVVCAPLSPDLLRLRLRLLKEEMAELEVEMEALTAALESGQTPSLELKSNMLKELADLQYVLSGMAITFGMPLPAAFARVHESNMSKLVDGKPLRREDGKILKGPAYKPPVLDDLAGY